MEYTKGKWGASNLIEPIGTFPRYYIECPHNNAIAIVDARNINAKADARLIAAAPRLLEWIKAKADNGDNDAQRFLATLGF